MYLINHVGEFTNRFILLLAIAKDYSIASLVIVYENVQYKC